jgi:hypothetical protein
LEYSIAIIHHFILQQVAILTLGHHGVDQQNLRNR